MIRKLRNLADWLECNKAIRYTRFNNWLDSNKLKVHHCKTCICEK
jgi:hypothetical protein